MCTPVNNLFPTFVPWIVKIYNVWNRCLDYMYCQYLASQKGHMKLQLARADLVGILDGSRVYELTVDERWKINCSIYPSNYLKKLERDVEPSTGFNK